MKYEEFRQKYNKYPIISTNLIAADFPNLQMLRNQLMRWQEKGLLIQLRRGFYVFNANDRALPLDVHMIANQMYQPSYISMEFALNYYGLIPERVTTVTSVTTKITRTFSNTFGIFTYQHLQPKTYQGFKNISSVDMPVLMADPEKAVLDFVYFNLAKFDKDVVEQLTASYRFQNLDQLNAKRLIDLGMCFDNKKLMRMVKKLSDVVGVY